MRGRRQVRLEQKGGTASRRAAGESDPLAMGYGEVMKGGGVSTVPEAWTGGPRRAERNDGRAPRQRGIRRARRRHHRGSYGSARPLARRREPRESSAVHRPIFQG